MKLENLILRLRNTDSVETGGGDIIFERKLLKVIADVPVYSIMVTNYKSGKTVEFNSVSSLSEYDGELDLRKCFECKEFIDKNENFYIDFEENISFCDYNCLCNSFNERFGKGNWTTCIGDSDDFNIWVKISADECECFDTYKVMDGVCWRKYSIEYITENYDEFDDIFGNLFDEIEE